MKGVNRMEDSSKKDRQLDNLINLVENHTRTERHLEQYSHIGDPANKENARKIQDIREAEIQELKEHIKGNHQSQTPQEQLQDLKEKYENTQGYIRNNGVNMNQDMKYNMIQKQENRKEQIQNLENNE